MLIKIKAYLFTIYDIAFSKFLTPQVNYLKHWNFTQFYNLKSTKIDVHHCC